LELQSPEIALNPKWKNNTDIINIECANEKYSLIKIYDTENNFRIEHLGKTIFKANEKGKDFMYEVYASKCLLIYDVPIPNNFASPYGHSKTFYLCNLDNNLTYRFKIGNYELSSLKPNRPAHAVGTKAIAFINNINTEKRELSLLFSDLETEEKVDLQLITF
jgi:hypothetical protein